MNDNYPQAYEGIENAHKALIINQRWSAKFYALGAIGLLGGDITNGWKELTAEAAIDKAEQLLKEHGPR